MPLWALFAGAQAVDVGFFVLVFAGQESGSLHPGEHPRFVVTQGIWSHSLVMTLIYGGAIAAVGRGMGRGREGLVLGLTVASHWLTDFVVHVPDLPVAFDQGRALGLGLWRVPGAAWVLECALLVGATVWWQRGRPASRRLWWLVAALCVLQTASEWLVPTPPTDVRLGVSALCVYGLACAGAWWVESPSRPTTGV